MSRNEKSMHTSTNGIQNARELILKSFTKRQRVNSVTDLDQLYRQFRAQYKTLTEDDIKAVFKELQDKGAGSYVIGRGLNPTRFIWRYNLKEVAERALAGLYNFKTLKPLEETSRARIIDPVSRKTLREAVTGPQAVKPRRRHTRKVNPLKTTNRASQANDNEITVQYQPSVRPVIQLNLELPASMSQKDIEALISLVTDARSSTN